MNDTLQQQLISLGFAVSKPKQKKFYCLPNINAPQHKKVYALPDGSSTTDYAEYEQAWLYFQLRKNVRKCGCASKLAYCW